MNVLLFNSSPYPNGCTYTALEEIAQTLKEEDVDSEIYQIGTHSLPGLLCLRQDRPMRYSDDKVNEFVAYARNFDGFIFGTPVHYGSACGGITAFLDSVFFINFTGNKKIFEHKPGAAIAYARRASTTTTLDQINKYFAITQMPIISGRH